MSEALQTADRSLWLVVPLAIAIGAFLGIVGGMVGLVLGNLRLPAVYFLLDSAPVAAGTNIGISGLSALGGAWSHIREGAVHWGVFWVMMPTTFAGAFLGGYLNHFIEPAVLLLIFSIVILYGGVLSLTQARQAKKADPLRRAAIAEHFKRMLTPPLILQGAVIGFVVGVCGGLVGLILGSLRMPAMLKVLRMEPRVAIGTNMTVGLVAGIAGVTGHLVGGSVDWALLGIMGTVSAVASYHGAKLTGKMKPATLLNALGVVLCVVAAAMFWQAIVKF